MKLNDFLQENGARQTAIKLVNMRLSKIVGLSIEDLPDSTILWDIVQDIEEELHEEDYNPNRIKESLQDITFELIEEICY